MLRSAPAQKSRFAVWRPIRRCKPPTVCFPARTWLSPTSSGSLAVFGACFVFWIVVLLGPNAQAQTNCATQYANTGAFICYPNPAENPTDRTVPNLFHLSAQANASSGKLITRYTVLVDTQPVYESRLAIPTQRLSIETNLKSPFDSGLHTLRVVVEGAGSADVKELQFYLLKNSSFCDPFSRVDARACDVTRNTRSPLRWSLTEPTLPPSRLAGRGKPTTPIDGYFAYMDLYSQNLKSIETDVGDAIAVDDQGILYVASHTFGDVELRKYTPGGSIVYDSLIRSCGEGFLSVTAVAIDNAGRAWIAGNTNGCLPASPNAMQSYVPEANRTRGFVMLIDTTKPSSAPPAYLTFLANVENRINAIRIDRVGNAYVTGTAATVEFPHESSLAIVEAGAKAEKTAFGFVSVLNPLGTGLLWSTLLPNAQLTAIALDMKNNVYVTGRMPSRQSYSGPGTPPTLGRGAKANCGDPGAQIHGCDDVLVAELSDQGQRISYSARLGGSGGEEGQAISVSAQGDWIFVIGGTDSPDFLGSTITSVSPRERLQPFAVALQPCRTGMVYARLISEEDSRETPGIALAPALDAFTAKFSGERATAVQKPALSIQVAPACVSARP